MGFNDNPFDNSGSTFRPDKGHGDLPDHFDLTQKLPHIGGADQVRADKNGNVINGTTHIGPIKLPWEP